jgi:tetratricopeptide (TPR) repeat protein
LVAGNYYRPLFLLWVRFNYAALGLRVMGWHLTAVLLHVCVTWLVYCLVKKLTGRFTVAWLTALIFGVHPIHHEVVAWVSGTTESLFAAMFLAAFLAYLKSRESSKTYWMIGSAAFYGLALLSKETAIVLPVLVFANEWIVESFQDTSARPGLARRFGRALRPAAFYVPIAAVYLIERKRVLGGLGHALTNISVPTWLLTLPSILLFYIKNWFFPVHLSEFYDVFFQSRLSLRGVVLPAALLVVIAVSLWMLRKTMGIRNTGYAAAWLLIPLLPALDTFVFRNGELVHDRYFYVPSIGAALLVALIIDWALAGQPDVFGQPSRVVGAALVLAAVLGLCTVRQVSYWQDDFTLFSRGHQIAPLNASALNNLAVELIIRKEGESAQTLLESGLKQFPGDERMVFNLGRLNYTRKDYSKSEDYARESMRLDPTSPDPYILIGQIRLKQGKMDEAIQAFRHGIALNPYDSTYHTSYGIVLKLSGDCAAAKSQFEEALALNPGDGIAMVQLLGCRASSVPTNNSAAKLSQH